MIYLSAEVTLLRKAELVWSVLRDVASYSTWVMGLLDVEHDAGPPFAEGSQFRVSWKLGPKKIAATTEITQLTEARSISTETRIGSRLVLLDRMVLAASSTRGGATSLVAESELVEDAGVMRLFTRSSGLLGAAHATRPEQAIYDRSFRDLKLLVEARTAAPYR